MEAHKRILGVLYIVSGALQIIVWLTLSFVMSVTLPLIFDNPNISHGSFFEWVVRFLGIIAFSVILLFAIPSIIGGLGLLNQKKWALMVVLVLGCFKLFSVPIGTMLGIYTLWVYSEEHRKKPAAQ